MSANDSDIDTYLLENNLSTKGSSKLKQLRYNLHKQGCIFNLNVSKKLLSLFMEIALEVCPEGENLTKRGAGCIATKLHIYLNKLLRAIAEKKDADPSSTLEISSEDIYEGVRATMSGELLKFTLSQMENIENLVSKDADVKDLPRALRLKGSNKIAVWSSLGLRYDLCFPLYHIKSRCEILLCCMVTVRSPYLTLGYNEVFLIGAALSHLVNEITCSAYNFARTQGSYDIHQEYVEFLILEDEELRECF